MGEIRFDTREGEKSLTRNIDYYAKLEKRNVPRCRRFCDNEPEIGGGKGRKGRKRRKRDKRKEKRRKGK